MNEKSFFQDLYKALEAEETHDHNPDPIRGSEDLFMATDPPPGGGAENSVQEGFTYMDTPMVWFPQKTPKPTLVGAPIPPAKPPVGNVCQALLDAIFATSTWRRVGGGQEEVFRSPSGVGIVVLGFRL